MNKRPINITSPYLAKFVAAFDRKSKGIKHSFKEWSFVVSNKSDGECVEFIFKLWTKKPSNLTVWVWDDSSICLDMRTYAKQDGWEFEHRVEGYINECKLGAFVELVKNISLYFHYENVDELNSKLKDMEI